MLQLCYSSVIHRSCYPTPSRYVFDSLNRSDPTSYSYLQRGWIVDLTANTITFTQKGEEKVEIPKEKLISANLLYARELEMIV